MTDVLAKDDAKRDLKIERVKGPSFKIDELHPGNETNYIWFQVDVTDVANSALEKDETTIVIEISEFFKRRRVPFPKRISIKEK